MLLLASDFHVREIKMVAGGSSIVINDHGITISTGGKIIFKADNIYFRESKELKLK